MTESNLALDGAAFMSGKCPVSATAAAFNPFDDAYLQDPYQVFEAVREDEPIFYSPEIGYWVVSRYSDIVEIFRDTETFSAAEATAMITPPCEAAMGTLIEAGYAPSPQLVDEDAPDHLKRRRVFRKGLNDKKVVELEPYTRRFVADALDAIVRSGRADLVRDMTFSVPALTAFILMGVPEAEVARVRSYATRFGLWIWGRPSSDQQVELAQAYASYLQYARQHVERLVNAPGDDYVSNLIRAWSEDPEETLWDKNYIVTIVQGHMYAAHETTTNAAAAGFRALLQNPSQWDAICADPTLIPGAVEEILRFQSSVPTWRRITTRPVKLGDYNLPAGSRILVLTGSANHDSEIFPDGGSFDITRENAKKHLAFGWGGHLCLGAGLARMELRVMLEETARRLPHLKLVDGQEWTYSRNTSFRGPEHVHVEWDPRANPQVADRP